MHKFLRSIGFSALQEDKDTEFYLQRAVHEKYRSSFISYGNGQVVEQYQLPVAPSMGITVVGHRDAEGNFHRDYYFPYMRSYEAVETTEGSIERHAEKETYAGVMEDFTAGITLIYYLCNSLEAHQLRRMQIKAVPKQVYLTGLSVEAGQLKRMGVKIQPKEVFLTGMAVEGKILLPIEKKAEDEWVKRQHIVEQMKLFEAAKAGDQDALETLTETDMNLMSEVNQRIEKEDLYSLVESTFMPTGVECDQYSILGEIVNIRVKSNVYTHENILDLKVKCMDAVFRVCINEKDLLGVPAIGRRFKGNVWMQGEVEFLEQNNS